MARAIVISGTQLSIAYHSALQADAGAPIIMIESRSVSRKYKYHKQKLAFVLTAMREYADELRDSGRIVHYRTMDESDESWFTTLKTICDKYGYDELMVMRQNDRTPQQKMEAWCQENSIELVITPNSLFLTSTSEFNEWAESQKRLQLEQFYHWQRGRLDILMVDGKPTGGKWNYDAENRKPLPKQIEIPTLAEPTESCHRADVLALIEKYFPNNPGSLEVNWLATTRVDAKTALNDFVSQRLGSFGDYEDAMRGGETFLFHSALSALLNVGLLHPKEVVTAALASDAPLASREGFIRQVIGWREFMFGLYNTMGPDYKSQNYLEQSEPLPDWWWQLKGAPEPPLEDMLSRLNTYGYSHHIERLMVAGNYMLLANYNPQEVYKWFMSMYVDAYEWVMVPNVIGMSQYADGGMDHGGFATKPYISGSNYLQKMGQWWPSAKAAQHSDWTKMYWDFLTRNEAKLRSNYRLRPLYKNVDKRRSENQ